MSGPKEAGSVTCIHVPPYGNIKRGERKFHIRGTVPGALIIYLCSEQTCKEDINISIVR